MKRVKLTEGALAEDAPSFEIYVFSSAKVLVADGGEAQLCVKHVYFFFGV